MSDISELFARDPLQLTTEDIDKIIDVYRKARAQFNLGDKSAGATKRVADRPKVEKLDLGDILDG